MPANKKQHYVPKVLLKNFTFKDKINIGLMNVSTGSIKQPIPFSPQCAIDYFYGKDLLIEHQLGKIEGMIGDIIRELDDGAWGNFEKNGKNHLLLTIFSVYQHIRTKKTLDAVKEAVSMHFDQTKKQLKSEILAKLVLATNNQLSNNELLKVYESVSVKLNSPHNLMFRVADDAIKDFLKLGFKILINKTNVPFIIGDNPLVYMHDGEKDCFYRMILPLTQEFLLVFYNSRNFKIGMKNKKYHIIYNDDDAFHINALQYINADVNVYFGPGNSLNNIISLFPKFEKFRFSNNMKLSKVNGSPFISTNRPDIKYKFSFVKKLVG